MFSSDRIWSEAEDELCRSLWLAGKSAVEIALQLPLRSRNSVIGRIHRKGWRGGGIKRLPKQLKPIPSRTQPIKIAKLRPLQPSKPKYSKKPRHNGTPPELRAERVAAVTSLSTRLLTEGAAKLKHGAIRTIGDLKPGQCKWPIGDPAFADNFSFCGAAIAALSHPVYCDHHARLSLGGRYGTEEEGQNNTEADVKQPARARRSPAA
jgi:GcrA cell cycle regulator